MKPKPLFLIVFVLIGVTALAQDPASGAKSNVWTLEQCIEYAMQNNLLIKRSGLNTESFDMDYRQSKWAMLPNLNVGAGYGYNWGRSLNPVTYEFTTQELNSLNPFASSSVTLFNGLRIQNLIKQTQRSYDAAKKDQEKMANDVRMNIALYYINVIFNQEQVENARYLVASTQAQLDRVRKQVEAGALSRSEQLNLEAQIATNEVNVVTQENSLALSLLQLKQALQLPASTPLDVALMDIEVGDLIIEEERDQIFDLARQSMPEIRSARLKVESAYYGVKAAKGSLFPRLTLNGSINSNYSSASDRETFIADGGEPVIVTRQIGFVEGTNAPVYTIVTQPSGRTVDSYGYREQLQDNIYRSVSLSISIPVFNNMQARYNWQRAIIQRKLAEINATEADNTLRQNVETAYNTTLAAAKTYQSAQRQLQAREEAFRMMEQRIAAGSANSFEYQVSQNDLFRAKTDLTRAKYDFIFRKKVLDFYQGKPLEY